MSSDTIKMTIKQKRLIMKQFKEGKDVFALGKSIDGFKYFGTAHVEQVIRDFMNGKFTMEPKHSTHVRYHKDCAFCESRKKRGSANEESHADHRRMREAIRNLEWVDGDPLQGEPRSCPVCRFYEGNPHAENCLWFECQENAK